MDLNFKPIDKTDFKLFAHWLGKPHVQRWWREPATVEHVSKEYGGCTRGDFTTRVYVVKAGSKPIGIIQAFKLESYPETAELLQMPGAVSIDYLIGEQDYIGRGYGTKMIRQFIDDVIKPVFSNTLGVATSVDIDNLASLMALRKAGFKQGEIIIGEYGTPERVMKLWF